MDESDLSIFYVTFLEANSLRNVISLLRTEIGKANFIFTPNQIYLSQQSQSGLVLVHFTINTSELSRYDYNACDEEGILFPSVAVGFTLADMCRATRVIKKKDGVRMFMNPGESHFCLQPITAGTKNDNKLPITQYVSVINLPAVLYQQPAYKRKEEDPNARILATEFATMCTLANTNKCSYVEMIGFEKGVRFRGVLPGKKIAFKEDRGQCPDPEQENGTNPTTVIKSSASNIRLVINNNDPKPDSASVKIPISTIKALSKINNLSAPGTMLKTYMETNQPAKITTVVGSYGMLKIYLNNSPNI